MFGQLHSDNDVGKRKIGEEMLTSMNNLVVAQIEGKMRWPSYRWVWQVQREIKASGNLLSLNKTLSKI